MGKIVDHAHREFQLAGWDLKRDPMQRRICAHVLKLLRVFEGEGHSGTSGSYALALFKKMAAFETIGPLTSSRREWLKISNEKDDPNGIAWWQSRRNSEAFSGDGGKTHYLLSERRYVKNGKNGCPYVDTIHMTMTTAEIRAEVRARRKKERDEDRAFRKENPKVAAVKFRVRRMPKGRRR